MKRRVDRILDWLKDHPESSALEISSGIKRKYLPGPVCFPELARLERMGKVTSKWQGNTYPRRRVYSVVTEEARLQDS